MRTLRWMPLLVVFLIVLHGGLRSARAGTLNVSASKTSGPTPAAVGPGVTSSAALSSSHGSPALEEEAYIVASSLTWSITGISYSADNITWGLPGVGQSHTENLTSASSSTTGLNFSGSPGYWRLTASLSVYYADNLGNTWNGLGSVVVGFTVVSVNIAVRQYGSSDEYASSVEIAAGHIDSTVHKAEVKITCSPPVAATVKVSTTGGAGTTTGTAVDLAFDSAHIGSGSYDYVTTGGDGTRTGTLLSSDVMGCVSVTGGGGTTMAIFEWQDNDGEDLWVSNPYYIILNSDSIQTVTLKHDGLPLDNHQLFFFVDYVIVEDELGVLTTIPYDPEVPDALDVYAIFSSPEPSPTNACGSTSCTLTIKGEPDFIYIHMAVLDESVNLFLSVEE